MRGDDARGRITNGTQSTYMSREAGRVTAKRTDPAPARRGSAERADEERRGIRAGRKMAKRHWRRALLVLWLLPACAFSGCASVRSHRQGADAAAYKIISEKQQEALGRTEPLGIESPADTLRRRLLLDQKLPHSGPMSLGVHDLPSDDYWDPQKHLLGSEDSEAPWEKLDPLRLTLVDALQVAARNSREYQAAKEDVFKAALDLDLERDEFRNTFSGLLSELVRTDASGEATVDVSTTSGTASLRRKLKTGAELSARLAVDLVRLLTQDRSSSLGLLADATVSIPLLRGSGRRIAEEPLTQAERNVVYAIYEFERFKKTFAVQVASRYLSVLRESQEVTNVEGNYKLLIASTRRARRLADAGKIPEFQFDQAIQAELRARDRWIRARQSHASRVDQFKLLMGLPPDAGVDLDPGELDRLQSTREDLAAGEQVSDYSGKIPPAGAPVVLREPGRENAGPLELDPVTAVKAALENRLDLRTARARVEDAQRAVFVAADALRAELTLGGNARAGEGRSAATADEPDARLDTGRGTYSALLTFDLPWERTAERNRYRNSLISLERAVRDLQGLEDRIKLEVRGWLRNLLQAREATQIQFQAMKLAEKRVRSTELFVQAGRAEIRDLLDAQEDLLSAQDALTSAVVNYRVAELELQRDLGVLYVSEQGLWQEYSPEGE